MILIPSVSLCLNKQGSSISNTEQWVKLFECIKQLSRNAPSNLFLCKYILEGHQISFLTLLYYCLFLYSIFLCVWCSLLSVLGKTNWCMNRINCLLKWLEKHLPQPPDQALCSRSFLHSLDSSQLCSIPMLQNPLNHRNNTLGWNVFTTTEKKATTRYSQTRSEMKTN